MLSCISYSFRWSLPRKIFQWIASRELVLLVSHCLTIHSNQNLFKTAASSLSTSVQRVGTLQKVASSSATDLIKSTVLFSLFSLCISFWNLALTIVQYFVFLHRQFGGYAKEVDYVNYAAKLSSALGNEALYHKDFYFCNGYDPPMKPYGRRNEVWLLKK